MLHRIEYALDARRKSANYRCNRCKTRTEPLKRRKRCVPRYAGVIRDGGSTRRASGNRRPKTRSVPNEVRVPPRDRAWFASTAVGRPKMTVRLAVPDNDDEEENYEEWKDCPPRFPSLARFRTPARGAYRCRPCWVGAVDMFHQTHAHAGFILQRDGNGGPRSGRLAIRRLPAPWRV